LPYWFILPCFVPKFMTSDWRFVSRSLSCLSSVYQHLLSLSIGFSRFNNRRDILFSFVSSFEFIEMTLFPSELFVITYFLYHHV
jgi:hypothetical protein